MNFLGPLKRVRRGGGATMLGVDNGHAEQLHTAVDVIPCPAQPRNFSGVDNHSPTRELQSYHDVVARYLEIGWDVKKTGSNEGENE
jgi:hypothetical protein